MAVKAIGLLRTLGPGVDCYRADSRNTRPFSVGFYRLCCTKRPTVTTRVLVRQVVDRQNLFLLRRLPKAATEFLCISQVYCPDYALGLAFCMASPNYVVRNTNCKTLPMIADVSKL